MFSFVIALVCIVVCKLAAIIKYDCETQCNVIETIGVNMVCYIGKHKNLLMQPQMFVDILLYLLHDIIKNIETNSA